jgi:hypothetical protein
MVVFEGEGGGELPRPSLCRETSVWVENPRVKCLLLFVAVFFADDLGCCASKRVYNRDG